MIVRGRVRVERTHAHLALPLVLAELGPGELVGKGEDCPCSNTVTAIEETLTVELDATCVPLLFEHYPDVAFTLDRDQNPRAHV